VKPFSVRISLRDLIAFPARDQLVQGCHGGSKHTLLVAHDNLTAVRPHQTLQASPDLAKPSRWRPISLNDNLTCYFLPKSASIAHNLATSDACLGSVVPVSCMHTIIHHHLTTLLSCTWKQCATYCIASAHLSVMSDHKYETRLNYSTRDVSHFLVLIQSDHLQSRCMQKPTLLYAGHTNPSGCELWTPRQIATMRS